jgi:hypothetical protein
MRVHGLLNGVGWAGAIGGVALALLMFLFMSVALQGARRDDRVKTLPSVQEGRAALGRKPAQRGAATPRATAPLPP